MAYSEHHYQSGLAAGVEISPPPLQGASKLIFTETDLTGPNAVPALHDPVYVGQLAGVVVTAPAAAGAKCIVQLSGIWSLTVTAQDDEGDANITVGSALYLGSDGVISLDNTGVLFGHALNAKTGSATPSTICVRLNG